MPEDLVKRAQIFNSFDALKGFKEILREQEVIKVEKRILSIDDYELLNRQIYKIEVGMIITIIYYSKSNYYQLSGKVSKINFDTRMLQIVKKKIDFKDIVEIHI